MFLLKIALVVVLVLVIEKPTTRTRTSAILAFFGGAAKAARASLLMTELEWQKDPVQRGSVFLAGKSPPKSKSSQERPLEEIFAWKPFAVMPTM